MLLLAFDTAGPDCAAALARDDADGAQILARRSERIGRGHAEALIPMIDEVLVEAGLVYGDIQRVAVTTGPGSFTGVRVGIAAARALALALGIPAAGIGSLPAVAAAAARPNIRGTVIAALYAKRGEVYVYAQDIVSRTVLVPPSAMPAGDTAGILQSLPQPLILTGSAAPLLADALGGSDVIVADTAESPDIADVALLGIAASPNAPPAPLYLRGADAKPQADKSVALL
jgi:tRNA threonylcarbamoyladenosine biosynthesis protein TsaB